MAECIYCKKMFARGKISRLQLHVAFECANVPTAAKHDVLSDMSQNSYDCEDDSVSKKPKLGQKSIENYTSSTRIGDEMKAHTNRELVRFLVMCSIPFKVVESPFSCHYCKV